MAELMNSLVPALGYALLHFLWQGTLIGLIAASALVALRRARPQVRYALACIALAACVLAPIVTVFAQFGGDATTTIASVQTSFATVLATGLQGAIDRVGGPAQIDATLPWVVALWAFGACLLSLRIASGVFWIQRLRSEPQTKLQAVWQSRLDVLAAQVGAQRAVAVRLVDALDTPASAGWWRPVVLLPTAVIVRMPVELVDALLAHELAHIRRHDYFVNLLQHMAEALLFYHPVVWWLSRQIRDERELIADQIAVAATGKPRELALALAELAELRCADAVSLDLAQAATGGRLLWRIQRLLRPDTAVGTGRLSLALVALAAACVAVHAQPQLMPRATLEDIVHGETQVELAQLDAMGEAEAVSDALASIDAEALADDAAALAEAQAEMHAARIEMQAAAEAAEDAATQAAQAEEAAATAAAEAADAKQEAEIAKQTAALAAREAEAAAATSAASHAAAEAASQAATRAAAQANLDAHAAAKAMTDTGRD